MQLSIEVFFPQVHSTEFLNHRIDHNNHNNNHLSLKNLGNFQNGGIFLPYTLSLL